MWTRLNERLTVILGLNPGKFTLQGYVHAFSYKDRTNVYLVGTGKERILVDAGQGIPEFKQVLIDCLSKSQVESVSDILITHRHYGGIQQVLQVCDELFSKRPQVWKYVTEKDKNATSLCGEGHEQVVACHSNSVYQPMSHNQVFQTEGASLQAIYTPGHSDDHMCFQIAQDQSLLAGDNVLGQGSTVFENLNQYMHSLRIMKELKPTHLYCGHGPVVEKGIDKIQEYMDHRMARERELIQIIKSEKRPWTAMELVQIIYKDYPISLHKPAEHSVILHLEKLVEDGVLCWNSNNQTWTFIK